MISYISLIFYMIAFIHIILFLLWGNKNVRSLFNIFTGTGLLFNIADMALRYFNTGAAPTSTLYDVMNMVCISFGGKHIETIEAATINGEIKSPIRGLLYFA